MIRQSIVQTLKTTTFTVPVRRTISTTAIRMAEGDAGAPRSGGAAQGDAFTKREQASEDYYMRQKEIEKLQEMRKKIAGHQKHLDELDKTISQEIDATKDPAAGKK